MPLKSQPYKNTPYLAQKGKELKRQLSGIASERQLFGIFNMASQNIGIAFTVLFTLFALPGQSQKKWTSLEFSATKTKIWEHSPKFDRIPDIGLGTTLEISAFCIRPDSLNFKERFSQGTSLVYYASNSSTLGSGVGIKRNVQFPIKMPKNIKSSFTVGLGGIFMNKHYNKTTNANNGIIGSSFNGMVTFDFKAGFSLNEHWILSLNSGFTHISNGAYQIPNSGINSFQYGLGINYVPRFRLDNKNHFYPINAKLTENNTTHHKSFNSVKAGFAVFEKPGGFGHQNFSLFNIGIYHHREVSRYFALPIGVSAEYTEYYSMLREKHPDSVFASRICVGLEAAGELFLNHYSIKGGIGYYLFNPAKALEGSRIYLKLSAQYYFKSTNVDYPNRLYLGAGIKCHGHVAQYPELVVGYLFARRS